MPSTTMTVLRMLLLVASAFVLTNAVGLEDVTPERAEAILNCLNVIICEIRRADQLKRIAQKPGPELYQKSMEWLAECGEMDLSNITVYWMTYSDQACNLTEERRRDCTKDFALRYADYYEETCEESFDPYECTRAEASMTEFMNVIEEHTVNGDCYAPEDMAKAVEEDAKTYEKKMEGAAEDMAGKMPTGNMPTGKMPMPTGKMPMPTGKMPMPTGKMPMPTGKMNPMG